MAPVHPLGRLISQRIDHPDNRWSLRAVVSRAEARGEKLEKSNLSKLKNRVTPQISRATVYGLAAGLGVTPLTVANAMLESWDIEPHPAEVTDCVETIRVDPSLGERQRAELIALVQAMRQASPDDAESAPPVPAREARRPAQSLR